MDAVTHKIIYFFFVHIFLRRIGKRYPDFFKEWISDYIENPIEKRILILRYTGETRKKFVAIALEIGMDESNMFKYHKRAVERLIA